MGFPLLSPKVQKGEKKWCLGFTLKQFRKKKTQTV
jgi:hypothetical protein